MEEVYVKEEKTVRKFKDVRCDRCNKELKPVFGEADANGLWEYLMPEGGLSVTIAGGYGMYIDPVTSVNLTAILCEECVDELKEKEEWLNRLIEKSSDY